MQLQAIATALHPKIMDNESLMIVLLDMNIVHFQQNCNCFGCVLLLLFKALFCYVLYLLRYFHYDFFIRIFLFLMFCIYNYFWVRCFCSYFMFYFILFHILCISTGIFSFPTFFFIKQHYHYFGKWCCCYYFGFQVFLKFIVIFKRIDIFLGYFQMN